MMRIKRMGMLGGALFLAACVSGGNREDPVWPALSVQPGETLLQARLNDSAGSVSMKRVGRNGSIDTWMSKDRYTISLDHGVLVATRGFGFDVMGSDAEPTLLGLRGGQAGVYTRRMRYLTGNEQSTWVQAGCRIGDPTREITAKGSVLRYTEVCQARRQSYTNSFWTADSGRIVRSRQWVSAEIGYIDLTYTESR